MFDGTFDRTELEYRPLLIRVEEAAKILSVSRTMVYELIRIEGLPVHRFNSAVRINPAELHAWLKERQKDR